MIRGVNSILFIFWGGVLMFAQGCDQKSEVPNKVALANLGDYAIPGNSEPEGQDEVPGAPSKINFGDDSENDSPSSRDDSDNARGPDEPSAGLEDDNGNSFDDDDLGFWDDDGGRPHGECGNAQQEVLPPTGNCNELIYGATIANDGTSTLVSVDKDDGTGSPIGIITNIHSVNALDFSPNGQLYAVGLTNAPFHDIDQDQSVLALIDCKTGEASIIGATNVESIESNAFITDINFNWQGQLYAHAQSPDNGNFVGTLNVEFGNFSPLSNPTGDPDQLGNGIGFAPFSVNVLYHADENDLSTIDLVSGIELSPINLLYQAPLSGTPRINAMDLDPETNIMYVSIREDNAPASVFAKLRYDISPFAFLIETPPKSAPFGLDAIAVNRHYEECDTGGDTQGCINCQLAEFVCDDGIDNDFDGLTDCEDSNCNGQVCNNGDPCDTDDVCIGNGSCSGEPLCDDENPCTFDDCFEGNCSFPNITPLNGVLGGCEDDGNSCTLGTCLPSNPNDESSPFVCFEQDRAFIPDDLDDDDQGCKDDNPCTADSCVSTCLRDELPVGIAKKPLSCFSDSERDESDNVILQNEFQCVNEVMENTACFAENECTPGICSIIGDGIPSSPYEASCVALPNESPLAHCPDDGNDSDCLENICIIDEGCQQEPVAAGTPCDPENPCRVNATCDGEGGCVGNIGNFEGECDDFNDCTFNDICQDDGSCQGTVEPDGTTCGHFFEQCISLSCEEGTCQIDEDVFPCDDDNPCTTDSCDDINGCFNEAFADNTPAGGPCTVPNQLGVCADGALVCIDGEPSDNCASLYPATAEVCNGLDDDCDGIVDNLESGECKKLVFLTSRTFLSGAVDPSLGFYGVSGADQQCQNVAANNPSLNGKTFRAWISNSNGYSPFTSPYFHANGPYTLVDGTTIVANDFTDLTDGSLQNAIGSDESQNPILNAPVWTGTLQNGTAATDNCNNWTDATINFNGLVGSANFSGFTWTQTNSLFCNLPYRLYCFEQ